MAFKVTQYKDQSSNNIYNNRFEAEISGTEAAAAAGLVRPVIGAGTYGAVQQRLEAAPLAQFQQARLASMMYPAMPPPPPPPPSIMVPQQVCKLVIFNPQLKRGVF